MSPRQVLFSSPEGDGFRVGAWSPHIMLMLPGVAPEQLGLAHDSKVDVIEVHDRGGSHSELIVKVPKWSDGSPVSSSSTRPSQIEPIAASGSLGRDVYTFLAEPGAADRGRATPGQIEPAYPLDAMR